MIVIAGRGLSVPVQNSMGVENMNTDLQCIVIQTITSHLPGGTCQGGQRLQEIILQLSSLGHSENVCDRWRRRSVLCTIIFQNLIPVAFLYSLCGQYHNHEVHVLLQNSFIISVSLSRSQEATLQHRNLYVSEGTVRFYVEYSMEVLQFSIVHAWQIKII